MSSRSSDNAHERLDAPSNRPFLDAVFQGRSIYGLLLVRRDGTSVVAQNARLGDWTDLLAQLDDEPIAPAFLRLVDERKASPS